MQHVAGVLIVVGLLVGAAIFAHNGSPYSAIYSVFVSGFVLRHWFETIPWFKSDIDG